MLGVIAMVFSNTDKDFSFNVHAHSIKWVAIESVPFKWVNVKIYGEQPGGYLLLKMVALSQAVS